MARANKRNTVSQVRFERNLSDNLISLYEEIRDRTYSPGRSICFIIHDPIQREVFAASFKDRIVHHYLYSKLEPIFEPIFIYDSYSCRKGKGTLLGVERLEHHIRSCSNNYSKDCHVLKLDIEGYFINIDRSILFSLLMKRIELLRKEDALPDDFDYDTVVFLLKKVVFLDPVKGCRVKGSRQDWKNLPYSKSLFYAKNGCGLPIGNLTSQLFSNIYLNELDQFCKRKLRCMHYGRYVDDFFIVEESKQKLDDVIPEIKMFLSDELRLNLNDKKTRIYSSNCGIPFLGAIVTPSGRYMRKRTRSLLEQKFERAVCCERNPFVLQTIENSRKGYYSHFSYGVKPALCQQNQLQTKFGMQNHSDLPPEFVIFA